MAIKELPKSSRFGVELAYQYFSALNKKIRKIPVQDLMGHRVSLSANQKIRIYTSMKMKKSLAR